MDSEIEQTVENIQSLFEDFEESYNKDNMEKLWDSVDDLLPYFSKLKKQIDRAMLE